MPAAVTRRLRGVVEGAVADLVAGLPGDGRADLVSDLAQPLAIRVLVPSTCREGTCGSCETTVIDGEIDHRDSVLGPDERARHDTMMVCVSRARSPRLVLGA